MGRRSVWATEVVKCGPMISPGVPSLPRSIEREFWVEVAIAEVAGEISVGEALLGRWVGNERAAGGVPTGLVVALRHNLRETVDGDRSSSAAITRTP